MEETPSTKVEFITTDPITSPKIMFSWFIVMERIPKVNSGSEVPMDTKIAPSTTKETSKKEAK